MALYNYSALVAQGDAFDKQHSFELLSSTALSVFIL